MSAVHYASLYRWDELFVLLTRSPWLVEEPGLHDVLRKTRPEERIWNLLPKDHGPWAPALKYPVAGPFPLDHFGNAIVGGRAYEYDDSGAGTFASSVFAVIKKKT